MLPVCYQLHTMSRILYRARVMVKWLCIKICNIYFLLFKLPRSLEKSSWPQITCVDATPSGTKSSLRRELEGKELVCSSGYYHTLKDKLDQYLLWLVYISRMCYAFALQCYEWNCIFI